MNTSNCSKKQKYARMLMITRIGVPCHSLSNKITKESPSGCIIL